MEKEIYEFIPFERVANISFNDTVESLIDRGFFIPEWWDNS